MAEKVLKVGVEREEGFLYYIDKDGDVSRVQMARGGKKGGPGAPSAMPFAFPSGHAYARRDEGPTSGRPASAEYEACQPASSSIT